MPTGKSAQNGEFGPNLEHITIAGIAGRFPESDSLNEFSENLFRGVDMVTDDGRRWTPGMFGTPKRSGKLKTIDKFDAEYFGVHAKQAQVMDPQLRILLEVTQEAILDSGVNPLTIRNTNTGVFIGAAGAESYEILSSRPDKCDGYILSGGYRTMLANRISFAFDFHGPSFSIDSACSSSFTALEQAVKAIRAGQCDAAIVGGVNLCLNPVTSLMYKSIGALSAEGKCKAFDASGSGFVRSEAVVAIYLTRLNTTPRAYATILHALTNTDGYKEEGITFPSGFRQTALLEQIYYDSGIDPCDVDYVEAHGTGTKAGDPQELNAISKVFCKGRGNNNPLLIGSVKSNMGHGEAAAGLCGLAKLVLAIHTGILPGNLHFSSPNLSCPALSDGRLQVVSKNTEWDGGLIGVSSFGFGGANAHVILQSNPKTKPGVLSKDPMLPLLVPFSGRTKMAVQDALKSISVKPRDDELVALLQNIFETPDPAYSHRGYAVLGQNEVEAKIEVTEVKKQEKPPVWFVFSGMGSQWDGMGKDLLRFEAFRRSLAESSEILKPCGVDLMGALSRGSRETLEILSTCFASIVSIQVAIVDLLSSIGIKPDGMIGHSLGELGCAYTDGCLTASQTVMAAYTRGQALLESNLPLGSMAAVGLSWGEIIKESPPGIFSACNNSADNVTVAGSPEAIQNYTKRLKAAGVFVKEVNSNGFAFHSPLIADAAPKLRETLETIITSPKPRSDRWISSSIIGSDTLKSDLAWTCSAEYFANNMISPVYFQDAVSRIPENAIVIEIAPHSLLQSILRRSLPSSCTTLGLTNRNSADNSAFFLSAVGQMILHDLNPRIGNLYAKMDYPVSTKASLISPLIQWDHSASWDVAKYEEVSNVAGHSAVEVNLGTEEYEFLGGHVIDGRILFPATGYLYLVWKDFASRVSSFYENLPVAFEDVRINRATILQKEGSVKFYITIFEISGKFEVTESGSIVASGVIRRLDVHADTVLSSVLLPSSKEPEISNKYLPLNKSDVYKELRLRGYEYTGIFQGIVHAENDASLGGLKWNKNWITFMDTLLQFKILNQHNRKMYLPTRIERIIIEPAAFIQNLESLPQLEVTVQNHALLDVISCPGIEMRGIKVSAKKLPMQAPPKLETYSFVPYFDEVASLELSSNTSTESVIQFCVQVAMDNSQGFNFVTTELLTNADNSLATVIHSFVAGKPRYNAKTTIVTTTEEAAIYSSGEKREPSIEVVTVPKVNEIFHHLKSDSHLVAVDHESLIANSAEAINSGSFVLLRNVDPGVLIGGDRFKLVSRKISRDGVFYLLRKCRPQPSQKPIIIYATCANYSWVEELKAAMHDAATNPTGPYVILTNPETDSRISGIVGLVNCLKLEPGGNKLRCFVTSACNEVQVAWDFNEPSTQLQDALNRDLVTNIFENGSWGFYRHVPIQLKEAEAGYKLVRSAYVNTLTKGNLSSLSWFQSPLDRAVNCQQGIEEPQLCTVYYSALNFRDIMLATGKLAQDALPGKRATQECILGFEFTGKNRSGGRVMGLLPAEGLASHVLADPLFTWDVPEDWTLAEAATVPMVYATAYYALLVRGKLKRGESVLIHSGSGGVGLAAIRIALSMGCTVFSTVGSALKKEFLQFQFPALKDSNIASSRDTSFEHVVLKETLGQGVDVVLNSLAGDKFQASVRCLAVNGRFLEIGKVDLFNNTSLGLSVFLKNVSFHGILMDTLFDEDSEDKRQVSLLVSNGISKGIVKPLPSTVFEDYQVEEAFRFMSSGKHRGKVVLKLRNEDDPQAELKMFKAIPQTYFSPWKLYIVVGGLGGFGLELANFLVERGVRKLILVSRSGITSGFQDLSVRRLRKQGVDVVVSQADLTTVEGATNFVRIVAAESEPVGAVFNLAMVLRDGLIQDLSVADFQDVARPKIDVTRHLDQLSRQHLPHLDHFVVFSSSSCGRGNPGQSNYGFANTVMERICEARRKDGLPGLAIQWGAIGDVGVVHERMGGNDVLVGGTVPQSLKSCLRVLDSFLQHSQPTLSSLVLPVTMIHSEAGDGVPKSMGLFESVVHILGMRDGTAIKKEATLTELGMDSLMGVEVKQLLDQNNRILSMEQIRHLTLMQLEEMNIAEGASTKNLNDFLQDDPQLVFPIPIQMNMENIVPKEALVRMNAFERDEFIFFIHPIEGAIGALQHLAANVEAQVFGLQCVKEAPLNSIPELAAYYISLMQAVQPEGPYTLLGYSFGCCIAVEIALQLESTGQTIRRIIFLDGSVKSAQFLVSNYVKRKENLDDSVFLNDAICMFLMQFLSIGYSELQAELQSKGSKEEKLESIAEILKKTYPHLNAGDIKDAAYSFFKKLKALLAYTPSKKLSGGSPILLRAEDNKALAPLGQDYGLSEVFQEKVDVEEISGDHQTCVGPIFASQVADRVNLRLQA